MLMGGVEDVRIYGFGAFCSKLCDVVFEYCSDVTGCLGCLQHALGAYTHFRAVAKGLACNEHYTAKKSYVNH